MAITRQLIPDSSVQMPSTQGISSGWEFLDQLGGAVIGAIPSMLDNVTKKDEDPAPVYIQPDQTPVHGDSALTKNDEANFLEKNWKYIVGSLLILGGFIYVTKK